MALSPLEIRQQEFKKGLFGYKKDDVDLFMETVEETVKELRADKEALQEEIEKLKTRVDELESQSSAVEETLNLARDKADKIKSEAQQEAEALIEETQKRLDEKEEKLERKLQNKKENLYQLKTLTNTFKQKFEYLLEEQGDLLEKFEQKSTSKKVDEYLSSVSKESIVEEPMSLNTILKRTNHRQNRYLMENL